MVRRASDWCCRLIVGDKMSAQSRGQKCEPVLLSDSSMSLSAPLLIRRSSRMRRLATVMLVMACLCAGIWIERDPLLRGMASLWIVSDAVTKADAAVVLGGGLDIRPFAAADLYRRGLVNKILISQVTDDRVASIGVVSGHTELNRQVLLKLGVPAAAIETFGTANRSTKDEALSLRAWAERNNASTFIIPTEIFSARRVQFIFRLALAKETIEVVSLDPPQYTKVDWWKTDTGLITFQNEIIKYLYYRIMY
jgi:uncharacterized SAM-binding protein YcdF (DUF218 family)